MVIGLAFRDIIPWWVAIILPARDAFLWCLVPFLRTRGYSALPGALPRQGRDRSTCSTPSRCCSSVTASGGFAELAQVFGWAFAIWGIGLYWWAGLLYAWQVRKLLADQDRRAPDVLPG